MTPEQLRRGARISVSLDVSAVPDQLVGVGRYVVGIVSALAASENVELCLISRRGDRERWHELLPGGRVWPVVPRSRPARLVWEQAAMGSLVNRSEVRVHHSPHYTMPERCRVPTVVTVHDMTFFDHPEWHERGKVAFFRRAIRVAARKADVVICDSFKTARRLEEVCNPVGLVSVVHLGVDLERFSSLEPIAGEDRLALGRFGVEQPYIAFVGTLEPRKGVLALVRAFDEVAAANPDITLVLAGKDGWGMESLGAEISAIHHANRVRRLGYVPEPLVAPLLRSAAVVVYPSFEEGFGLPVLEALACGAPVVTTRGSAMEEVAGDVAWLVEPGNVEELAWAITSAICEDSRAADRRREAGVAKASEMSWASTAEGHVRAYLAALGH